MSSIPDGAFAEWLDAMTPSGEFTFASFEQENPEIAQRLRRFSIASALTMIASLQPR